MSEQIKNMVQTIVEALVDEPEKLKVVSHGGGKSCIIEVTTQKADLGKIIGKKGRTAEALRHIVTAAAAKNSQRVTLEIVE